MTLFAFSCIPTQYKSMLGQGNSFVYSGDEGYYYGVGEDREDIPVSSDAELNRLSGATRGVAVLSSSVPTVHMDLPVSVIDDFYVVIHYYNPSAVSKDVTVDVDGIDKQLSFPFCPDKSGCRVAAPDPIKIDLLSVVMSVTLRGNSDFYLVSVGLIASRHSNSEDYISPLPADLNARFISECSANEFGVGPNSTAFCMESARSVSAIFHNGSVGCSCDVRGSVSPLCDGNTCTCQCKLNVVGLRCSQCKVGHYGFPSCRPCNCAGGGICDVVTGQCLCAPNVEGRNCDRCKRRFYDFHPVRGCIACNCDSIGSSGLNCNRRTGQCRCKQRFSGRRCDQCLAGKYGSPECRDCGCDAQGGVSNACNQQTGQCQCKANVDGRTCNRCKDGAFNYTISNPNGCELCNCDVIGSVNGSCDKVTGQCECKENVIGLQCDSCAADMYRLLDGSCAECNCHFEGSSSLTCNVRDGKCPCRRFVRGRQCSRCLRGHYQLSSSGCQPCGCSRFGSNGECDLVTGQCVCLPGSYGKRCDQCAERHVVGPQGCRRCGYCTDRLMDDLEGLIAILNETNANISDFSVLVHAWSRLSQLIARYNRSNEAVSDIVDSLDAVDVILGDLELNHSGLFGRVGTLLSSVENLELQINSTFVTSVEAVEATSKTKKRADDVLQDARAFLVKLNTIVDRVRRVRDLLQTSTANVSALIAEAQQILNEIMARNFMAEQVAASKAVVDANNVLRVAEQLRNESQSFVNEAARLQMTLHDHMQKLKEAKDLADNTIMTVNDVDNVLTGIALNTTKLLVVVGYYVC